MEDIGLQVWSHYNKMCRLAWKLTKDPEESKDLVMDAILHTLERVSSDNPPNFKNGVNPYLNAAIRNRIWNHRRKQEGYELIPFDAIAFEPVTSYHSNNSDISDVLDLLYRSPEWIQEAITAKLECECDEDAAKRLNISLSAFKVRLHRARKYLRSKYYKDAA